MKFGNIHKREISSHVNAKSSMANKCRENERLFRIAIAAYFKAQARGFAPGHEMEDWLAAEAEEKSWQLH